MLLVDAGPAAAVEAVPARGYRWWYVDGLSDDGRRGFTAIFLVGSVFSPWFAERAWRGEAVPAREHLGIHLALYEDEREVAWTMSEYPATALGTEDASLRIGGSTLRFGTDGTLSGSFDERTAPIFWSGLGLGRPLRGRFTLSPEGGVHGPALELGQSPTGDRHHWQVRVPRGRISVEFDQPGFRFEGRGYHDSNWGEGRLEEAFQRWSWARFHEAERSRILYAVVPRQGDPRGFVVEGEAGRPVAARADRPVDFAGAAPIGWGLHAPHRFLVEDPAAGSAEVVRWLDRAPFYARYVARLDHTEGVGEYLDLDRFARPGVQFLLRWRAQRRS